jgi:tryptophan synthase beta chain
MYDFPDQRGHFGPYGGVFVSETLMYALEDVESELCKIPKLIQNLLPNLLVNELKHFVGRPSPI